MRFIIISLRSMAQGADCRRSAIYLLCLRLSLSDSGSLSAEVAEAWASGMLLAVHPVGTAGVDVRTGSGAGCLAAINQQTGQVMAIPMQPSLATAVDTRGLRNGIGSVHFLQVHAYYAGLLVSAMSALWHNHAS